VTVSKPSLQVGAVVELTTHHVEGRIVEVLSGQRYRIALGSIHLIVKASEISVISQPSGRREKVVPNPIIMANRPSKISKVRDSIDLHGLLVDEACRLLEKWLNDMILSGSKRGTVIHGLGSGRVRTAAHRILNNYKAVSSFKINEANPGETIVYIA
jgi:DNA mismatch repair protein MutS2